jgi:VCBS repeat-containing protein
LPRRRAWRSARALGTLIVLVAGLTTLAFPRSALAASSSTYNASSGVLPDAVCPTWTLTDTADPENPLLSGGKLTLSTDTQSENMFYAQQGSAISMPSQLVVEARMRLVSGSSSVAQRAPAVIGFATAPSVGNGLWIGRGEIFLSSGEFTRGPSAAVDTQTAVHTYRIEVATATGAVRVLYDGALKLTGTTYTSSSDNGPAPRVSWGEGSSFAFGTSEWLSISHNASASNCPPLANDDRYGTAEDAPLTVGAPTGLLANDSDVQGDPLSVAAASVTDPGHGTVAVHADGSFTYTPTANFNGTDSFTYKASDGLLDSTAATVTITVSEVNDPPTAVADQTTLGENTSATIDVTANDTPGPANEAGQTLAVSSVSQPAHGEATVISSGADAGKVHYTPAADYNGSDSFTYSVCDNGTTNALADPKCDTASVDVTITAANHAPAAQDDSYTTDEDTPLTVPAPGVLANDSDADGNPISVAGASVTDPGHGTLILNADGSFTYTPAADFNGSDSFTYKASDGSLTSDAATTTITVAAAPDAPVARDNSYATEEDTPLTVSAPGVLANDSDADGDPLTSTLVAGPAHGTLTHNPDGSFAYTPAANFNGEDSFTYKASDGTLTSNLATVTITVAAVPDAPIAHNDSYSTDENTPLTVPAPGVLANDSDADGDLLTASLVAGPGHGTLNLSSNGSFNYTPVAGFYGTDSFGYVARDRRDYDEATVTITVVAAPGIPIARDDSYRTDQGTPLTVPPPGVLANDFDADGDRLSIALRSVTNPAHGTLDLSYYKDSGGFKYTPAPAFSGQDSFTYKASDGTHISDVATVTITVAPKLLFTSTRDGNSEVYVMNSDGTGVTRLTTNTAADTNPVWSPDHRKIAFSSTRDGNSEIYVMNADGTAPARRTSNSVTDMSPTWSPDGTKIAFASGGGSKWDIYVVNADGTSKGPTRLTSNPNPAIYATPAWSPDGGRIAFSSTRNGNLEIYVMPASGEICQKGGVCTTATRLTTNPAIDTSPTWLGTRIAFASTRDDSNSEIYVMNADGTASTRLTTNPASDTTPAGSPDGQRIAFASTRDDTNSEIYAMQADGTAVTRLTTNPATDTFPDW